MQQKKAPTNEAERYLCDDQVANLQHKSLETRWKEQFQHIYPGLAHMVMDILAIPASGAGVERLFNQGRDITHHRRGRLQAKTIESLMMLRMHADKFSNISLSHMDITAGGQPELSESNSENADSDDENDQNIFVGVASSTQHLDPCDDNNGSVLNEEANTALQSSHHLTVYHEDTDYDSLDQEEAGITIRDDTDEDVLSQVVTTSQGKRRRHTQHSVDLEREKERKRPSR